MNPVIAMLFFISCVALLIGGYLAYGLLVEKIFKIQPLRKTPALEYADGVDYVAMPTWKVFLVQLLDIAGIGPIFGPIMGALYGPEALLWIVIGSIFAGGVHDFFSGMLSIRNAGENMPSIVGRTLGSPMRYMMLVFTILLLLLVGVVFVLSPAAMLSSATGIQASYFITAIFIYYFMATIFPVDKVIGLLYPFFGLLLLFMTFGIFFGMVFYGHPILADIHFGQRHPEGLPLWPLLFITLSCGAISGFHSTQSPLMSRCLTNEKHGRLVFYGAMIAEGIIALVWATVGLSLYQPDALAASIQKGTAALVVSQTAISLLGPVGGFLAILGVVVLPITSGDTAFRSARLVISEALHISQRPLAKRLLIAIPLFITGFIISTVNFSVIWRYFGWSNQALSALVLWTAAFYLVRQSSFHWIASIPAAFLTAVVVTYICNADIGLALPYALSSITGVFIALIALVSFALVAPKSATGISPEESPRPEIDISDDTSVTSRM